MQISPLEAIQKAYQALQHGDKRTAHRWAAYAAQVAPGLEEAWLMLAACSGPRASLAYLERALQVNPSSQRARQGIRWARQRLDEQARIPRQPVVVKKAKKTHFGWIGATLTFGVLTVSLALAALWLGSARADSPQPVAAQLWAESTLQLPQPSPSPSASPSASPTPLLQSPPPAQAATDASVAAFNASATPTESPSVPLLPLETATQAPIPTATLVFEPPTPSPSPDPFTPTPSRLSHTLQSNDTLDRIAGQYGVGVAEILAFNGLESAEQALPGLELFIPPPDYTAPAPAISTAKWILVDISEQHLYAYEGQSLVYSFVASTGMGNSTRVGTFEVLDKIPSAYGATWDIWMPSWMGIYWSGHLENGIHALPILPNGATLWQGYLGTPISYGCVVLGTYEAQLLYDWAEVGVPVHIQW